MDNYYAGKRPGNINTVDDVKIFQRALGVPVTGVWDSRTKTACLIQPAKAKKVGNDIAKLREASKSNVNTPQIKPAGVTPYNWAKVNVLPTASDYPGSKRAAPTSAGLLGAGTIAYLQNHREKNKSGDLSGLGRSSSSTASSGSGYHPGYTGGLGGWDMTDIWKSMPNLEPLKPSSNTGSLQTKEYKSSRPVWSALGGGYYMPSNSGIMANFEEGFDPPPIPKEEWSAEHAAAVEQYNTNHKDHQQMKESREGKSYDPLSIYAAEKLDILKMLNDQLEGLYNQTNDIYTPKELTDAIRKKELEVEQALQDYAAIPILLTEDTLTNPYAAEYAELLSIRMPITQQQQANISAAIEALNNEIQVDRQTGDWANASRALDVRNALALKADYWALIGGAANGVALNIPRVVTKANTIAAPSHRKQLVYMSGLQGIENSNPLAYEGGDELSSAISLALELMGIPSGDPSSGLVDIAFDYETGRSGNLIEDILDMLENK